MSEFFLSFFPPVVEPQFLGRVAKGTMETLAISLLGTGLAALGGMALAVPAAGRPGTLGRAATRLALNVLRAVPELVWAATAHALAALFFRIGFAVEAEGDVFFHGEPGEQFTFLRHVADLGIETAHFFALADNPAGAQTDQAGD